MAWVGIKCHGVWNRFYSGVSSKDRIKGPDIEVDSGSLINNVK